ncbi:hypothetical protein, partial [Thiolapillus sp.]
MLIQRKDVLWTGVPGEDYLNFGSVVVSGDNSKLMFNVTCEFCQAPAGFNNRPFVADTNGGNVTDISDLFPVDLASSWSGWGNMALDDDGSKAFISVLRSGGEKNIYYKDLSSGNNYYAVNSNDFSNAWLNHDASALYLGKFDAGYDDILKRHKQGLWWAQLGGAPRWYLDIHDMPCNGMCDNLNALGYMGNSKRDDHTFFVWNSGAPSNICAGEDCNHNALWHSQLDGRAETLTDREHYWVSSYVGGWRGISTERGETVLYSYIDRKGDPQKLVTVDRANRAEKELTWTTSLNGFDDAFITPSGRYAAAWALPEAIIGRRCSTCSTTAPGIPGPTTSLTIRHISAIWPWIARCQPWRAKRRLVDPSSREAALLTRRAHSARGEAKQASKRGVQSLGDKYGAATSLRSCCAVLGDQDGWGTNRLSKAES